MPNSFCMMTDFMGDNVPLGKIAIRAKFVFHFIIEGEIDINRAIRRAIERPHNGLAAPQPVRVIPRYMTSFGC